MGAPSALREIARDDGLSFALAEHPAETEELHDLRQPPMRFAGKTCAVRLVGYAAVSFDRVDDPTRHVGASAIGVDHDDLVRSRRQQSVKGLEEASAVKDCANGAAIETVPPVRADRHHGRVSRSANPPGRHLPVGDHPTNLQGP